MPIAFTFPTGDDWLLIVHTVRRPLLEDTQYSTFLWYKLSAPYPAGQTQAGFEGGAPTYIRNVFYPYLPVGTVIAVNYYMQSTGKKFSNTVNFAAPGALITPVLPTNNCLMLRFYDGVHKDHFVARKYVPLTPTLYLDNKAHLTVLGRFAYGPMESNLAALCPIGPGVTATPQVYHPTTDTFSPINRVTISNRSYVVRRRRIRANKAGHVVTAPLNWYAAGHW